MDLSRLWADVVRNVASEAEEKKEANIIRLFSSQVSIAAAGSKITFYCTSKWIYDKFQDYVYPCFTELQRQLGKNNLTIDVQMAGMSGIPAPQDSSALPAPEIKEESAYSVPESVPPAAAPLPPGCAAMETARLFNRSSAAVSAASAASVPQPAAGRRVQDRQIQLPRFMREDHINPNKTFENYVPDPENNLIYIIAQKVAAEPGSSSVNPFYIYGGSGLGKTHLLFAIANRIKQTRSDISLIYTRAEGFIRSYVESMSRKNAFDYQQVHFQELYTTQDVFIVDDIQNFIKGPKARDTFFDIIADFLEKPNRQLILASDVPPGNLKDFSPRLKSRFGSGVCREIFPPGTETRTAITLNKCREFHVELSDAIVDYIASHIRSNIREIEGAIKTLNSHIESFGSITYEEAVRTLSNLVNVPGQTVTMDAIKERVAKEFDVTVASLDSAQRKKAVSQARSLAMTLAHDLIPSLSLNDIGRAFSKDHSSVHEAIKRTRQRADSDAEMAAVYQKLKLSLKRD